MSIELRDELRRRYGTVPVAPPLPDQVQPEKAFVVQSEKGRTVITAPMREIAMANQGFTYLRGRFVEADSPNRNGAMWTSDDLQLGEATVAGGPLNWLHQETTIIGSLLDGQMVAGREAAALGVGNHIQATAAVWRFLFPQQADTIEKAAKENELYFSMECVSRQVACIDSPGRPGCGESFEYADFDAGKTCQHLREKSSVRRFIDPIFLGGACIVPPVQPGWAGANAEVIRQAAELREAASLDAGSLTRAQAEDLATAVLQWANRS